MKISDIETNVSWLKITDLDNFFNVYLDKKNRYVHNLNQTIYLNIPDQALKEYTVTCDTQWTLISYNIYDSTRLAWVLMKLNNVTAKNVFETVQAGTVVKYIDPENLRSLVKTINDYGEA